jgi:hypothetical protein
MRSLVEDLEDVCEANCPNHDQHGEDHPQNELSLTKEFQ